MNIGALLERQARYQRIHTVVFQDNFPRSAAGKTLKRLLRDPYWADTDANL